MITKNRLHGVVYLKSGKKYNVWLRNAYELSATDLTISTIHLFKLRGWFQPGFVFVQGNRIDHIVQLQASK